MSVQAPHICALILLPPLPAGANTELPCHGNSYMAVDLFAAAAVRDTQVNALPKQPGCVEGGGIHWGGGGVCLLPLLCVTLR